MKWIPPFSKSGKAIKPVDVKVAIEIFRVMSVDEENQFIELQFGIRLEWNDYRLTYHNLNSNLTLNALSAKEIESIWLPQVMYTNTKQIETTRLGENWEWTTNVWANKTITRKADDSWVDETEIYEGSQNNLVMIQWYTHEFQCIFKLGRYPFDTQVRIQ